MKKYLKDYELTLDDVKHGVYDCLDGKTCKINRWKRKDTSYFIAEYIVNNYPNCISIHLMSKRIRKIACRDKTILYRIVDNICKEIYLEIKNRSIHLDKIRYEERYDSMARKSRKIGISSMKQQCYDYIIVDICKNMFLSKIGHYQCASLKYKGQLFGKQAIESWIRTNPKKCKWIFKCDVKKFYPSVNHDILKNLLTRDIKNKDVLYILFTLIDTYEEGLCIGSYLSQFLANYYLSYAYHYITEMTYTVRRNKRVNLINHTLFYMDDIILFGSNKKHVKKASKLLEEYLNNRLNLTLKQNYQLFPLDSRPIDMMGYKIYTYKTTIRKRIFNRANKMLLKSKRNNFKVSLDDAYKIVSYNGYFKYTFSTKYKKKVKYNRTLKNVKEMISNECKSRIH